MDTPFPELPPDELNPEDEEISKPILPERKISPVPGYNTSPVRPQSPEQPPQPILPSVPRPSRPEVPTRPDITRTQEMRQLQSSQEALESLRRKMALVAEEFAQGKINRAQFHAIYQRYQEQRDITEQLVKRDPKTGAWQTVVQPGHTSFLRDHFEAKVESYSIYHIQTGQLIIRAGALHIPHQQILPILNKLKTLINKQGNPGVARRRLGDKKFVIFVPEHYAVTIAIFSLEPASAQLEMIQDMHRDFERANGRALEEGQLNPHELVFPHRALIE